MPKRIFLAVLVCAMGVCRSAPANAESPAPVQLPPDVALSTVDPNESSGMVNDVFRSLSQIDPGMNHKTYEMTYSNFLDDDASWILQTPTNIWGVAASQVEKTSDYRVCKNDADCRRMGNDNAVCGPALSTVTREGQPMTWICHSRSQNIADEIYKVIVSATDHVDMLWLMDPPNKRFFESVRNAITYLANKGGPRIVIRMAFGQGKLTNYHINSYLNKLLAEARKVRGSNIELQIAQFDFKGSGFHSWNHSKIIEADGALSIVGGQNFIDEPGLGWPPIFDLSMRVRGSAATSAHKLINEAWSYIRKHNAHGSALHQTYCSWSDTRSTTIHKECPHRQLKTFDESGKLVTILALAKPGKHFLETKVDPSEYALETLISKAQKTIRFSQQDFAWQVWPDGPHYPERIMTGLVDFVLKHKDDKDGHVYIVLSSTGAVDSTNEKYSLNVRHDYLARKFLEIALKRPNAPARDKVIDLLCKKLHLAPLRFSDDKEWPGSKKPIPIGNHAKAYAIDDSVFYIGSDNVYPNQFTRAVSTKLLEYGYLVDNKTAATQLMNNYWNKLWEWSQKAAIMGSETSSCVLLQ